VGAAAAGRELLQGFCGRSGRCGAEEVSRRHRRRHDKGAGEERGEVRRGAEMNSSGNIKRESQDSQMKQKWNKKTSIPYLY